MLRRLHSKNNRNVLLQSFIDARGIVVPSRNIKTGVKRVPTRKRYIRSRHLRMEMIQNDDDSAPASPFKLSSCRRRNNFGNVLSAHVPAAGAKPKGGLVVWRKNFMDNLLGQIKRQAPYHGRLSLTNFQVFDVLDWKKGDLKLRFVASNNYRGRGPRYILLCKMHTPRTSQLYQPARRLDCLFLPDMTSLRLRLRTWTIRPCCCTLLPTRTSSLPLFDTTNPGGRWIPTLTSTCAPGYPKCLFQRKSAKRLV